MLGADHVGLRDQTDAQELREHPRVDPIGLHLCLADRLHILRVGEAQVNPGGRPEVAQPVPALHALDDGAVWSGERAKVRHHRRAVAAQLCLSVVTPSASSVWMTCERLRRSIPENSIENAPTR